MAEVAPGTSKIFVRYRNTKPSEDEMRGIFSKHGVITDVKLYAKFCFIEYDSETAAQLAVAAENGTKFKDIALEVETVVRNVPKQKANGIDEASASTEAETVRNVPKRKVNEADEASASSTEAAASELQATPSADVNVKKLKQDVLPTDALTKHLSPNEPTEVPTTVVAENAINVVECRRMAAEPIYVSTSTETPNLGEEPFQLNRKHRRYRARKQRAEADKQILPLGQSLSPEKDRFPNMSSQSPPGSTLRSKSKDRCVEWRSLSAVHSYGDQPYDPYQRYPDYALNSLPPANSHPYTSTTHDWSGYSPARQTYTTAYPHANPQIYSSNYTAECSQVSTYSAGPSYYGSHEKPVVHGFKQTDQSELTHSHRARNDSHGLQEGYSMGGDPSIAGKTDQLDRPHLPDLVHYSSVLSDAKPLASDKPRELRDPVYESTVESYRTSLPRATTSSARVAVSVAEGQGHQRSDSANDSSGMCELIITEPHLRQYGLKVASKVHSTGLKVEICDLPPGMTIMEEVEDAMIRGRLFAVVITERHVEHNSVTVDVLHGVAEEHRNMLLDDAVRLITNSYQDYMAAKRASAKPSTTLESSKEKADAVVPDERTQVLITRLARNHQLSYEELEQVIIYLRQCQERSRKASNVLGSLPGRSTEPPKKEESKDLEIQRNLEATIFSILKGEATTPQQPTSSKPTHHPSSYQPPGHYIESGEPYASVDYRRGY